MRRLTALNINSRTHWNNVYGGSDNRAKYERDTKGLADRYVRFEEAVKLVKKGDSVLDIGCGTGLFCRMALQAGAGRVVGCDISTRVVRDNANLEDGCEYFVHKVGEKIPLRLYTFDLVFSGETLEHLDSPSQLFSDAYKLLKNGGRFAITTPLNNAIKSTEHVYSFNHDDIESMYIATGFKHVKLIKLPEPETNLIIYAVGRK